MRIGSTTLTLSLLVVVATSSLAWGCADTTTTTHARDPASIADDAGHDMEGDSAEAGAGEGSRDTDPSGPSASRSDGCGSATFAMSGTYTMDVNGTQRTFIIKLPDRYDPNRSYKLVFGWHYLSGDAAGIANGVMGYTSFFSLEELSEGTTIFVAPDGLGFGPLKGWSNTGGRDVAFARAMVDKLNADYCVDTGRIFSIGFSFGGIMSNTLGCEMGDVFRAIAPGAGSGPSTDACVGQVAAWLFHGGMDTTISVHEGEASRDHWVSANGCDGPGPADANGCVWYEGCDPGYPVVWCMDPALAHEAPAPDSYAAKAIWNFFASF